MVIFDQNGEVVENPDQGKGTIEYLTIPITYNYVVDKEATGHWEVVAEYENGGKDIEYVLDTTEEGHWEVRDEQGEIVEHFDGTIPEGLDRTQATPDQWTYGVYTPYSEEHLAELERQSQIFSKKAELARTDYVVIKIAESMVSDTVIDEADYERYAGIVLKRQQLRKEINALEEEVMQDG